MKLITRGAAYRLGALFTVLTGAAIWAWASMIRMPGESYEGRSPPLDASQVLVRDALRRDVKKLAGEIGERHFLRPDAYEEARRFIASELAAVGPVDRHSFDVDGRTYENLVAQLSGGREIVVVGAHYDTAEGSPGANDNATGIAALLALARRLSRDRPTRTLRFVAFANEEPPHFQNPSMGSLQYARACRRRGDRIVAMLSLETMGYYSDRGGSQSYPFPFSLFYPSRGNFLTFVGSYGTREDTRRVIASFRRHARVPSEGGAPPAAVAGVGWSDHWSFWQAGYPGVMVTDTALFRYPHYHTAQDTPDKVDYTRLALVVDGLALVIAELGGIRD